MLVDVVMPKMGESITEGTVLEWRKKIGETVEKDELFLEIGTDKVDSEIPCSESGTIVEILAIANDVVDVGTVIARIETDESLVNMSSSSLKPEKMPKPKQEIIQSKPSPPSIQKKEKMMVDKSEKKFYTPVVLKIVSQENIPLSELENILGTGRGGRVTKKDILGYIENRETAPAPVEEHHVIPEPIKPSAPQAITSNLPGRTEEMHHMRKMIADHMRKSIETSAHVYVMTDVDMTPIVEFVKMNEDSFLVKEGFKLTFTPFMVDAVVKALQDFPEMNSSLSGTSVTYHKNINVGLAVAIENGLMVPAMFNCEEKNFLGLCRTVSDVATRTRNKQISADELTGSTFAITNFGVFGVTIGTPIINQPNVGILGIGAIKKQAVVVESNQGDAIAIRSMMMLSLGFDHRLIDGAGGAKFLERVRHYLETMNLNSII
ncbi:MAG: 2-oxo acid dehydrogenase subunit E2 [Candidatus Marinimicrobia bacterium]|jgi:2-oxoglutarate dehydrogenase E2 component (dihydrolipoamide succinyltransferase)|nr:2-oxo acid dehydrogenase subunit E2 [Candidatus Neomarinimicrobiota bacterium]MBT3502068.1 2-oxo acid dehydrogenase subunit E2 [Candidatus Neomarinimicrobiota bacterium]MBT3840489.1 2-oxo acid dehydrogenase subunit E2 [Candidatus Neomarinimicrobiota bacterium]MBT3999957.1 2-oxo acid dehydrogenase subunit E2 [Candidatus Neomarinimicrobiota bacterium]MBT4283492.1 2-oxo acid dehydrogenase subunit E2 [Candidatus Neomarinimicrobiota bacterium]